MDVARRLFLCAAAVRLTAANDESNQLTSEERAAGWTLLFNGHSTAGWQEVSGLPFPSASWNIEDGCLHALDPGTGIQDIRTEATFTSFEFQFDWKVVAGGNSGVKYLVQRTDRWINKGGLQSRARGLEYQVVDNDSNDAREPSETAGALYHALAPSSSPVQPLGIFNHSVLVLRRAHVEHWLNGHKILEFETTSPQAWKNVDKLDAPPPPGRPTFLALQNHGTPVWFRNLKVRRIPNSLR